MSNSDMPAMPHTEYDADGNLPKGLTKREHFAGLALQGLSASDAAHWLSAESLASLAVEKSDALLAELERNK